MLSRRPLVVVVVVVVVFLLFHRDFDGDFPAAGKKKAL
jgi:hypothetical protein